MRDKTAKALIRLRDIFEKQITVCFWVVSLLHVIGNILFVYGEPYYRIGNTEILWILLLTINSVFLAGGFGKDARKSELSALLRENQGRILEAAIPIVIQAIAIAFVRYGTNWIPAIACLTEELFFALTILVAGILSTGLLRAARFQWILTVCIGLLPKILRFGSNTYPIMVLEFAVYLLLLRVVWTALGRMHAVKGEGKNYVITFLVRRVVLPIVAFVLMIAVLPKGKTFLEVTGYLGRESELTTDVYGSDEQLLWTLYSGRYWRPLLVSGSESAGAEFQIFTKNGSVIADVTQFAGSRVVYLEQPDTGLIDLYVLRS